jgi:cyclin B
MILDNEIPKQRSNSMPNQQKEINFNNEDETEIERERERGKENKHPENKRYDESKKNNYKIKVIQNFKKENKENIKISEENIENNKPIKNNNFIKNKGNKENIEINLENKETEEKVKYFDTSKINNIQVPKDYINIIYYNLLKEEDKGILPQVEYDYMKNQKEINDKMRSILIDWIIDVHFKFGFTDETLFMTVSIIDRYLTVTQIKRSNFQLLGITALLIACKHEEIDLPKVDDFIYITDNAYVKNDVIKMEEDVLSKLNFEFLYPSPIKFFEYLSLHFNFEKKHHLMGKYLMETFLLDIKNTKFKPSIISCACAYIVMKFFKFQNYYESYQKKFYTLDENKDKYSEFNIKECARDICLFVDNINKTNYQACAKKYSKPEQEKVAIIIMNN